MKNLNKIIINCFDSLLQEKINNNKKPLVTIYEIQQKIHSNFKFEKIPIKNGKEIKKIIGEKKLKFITSKNL